MNRDAKETPLDACYRIQEEVSAEGFDWPEIADVIRKLREEIGEFEEAIASEDRAHAARELGDILFVSVNLARFLEKSASNILDETNARFARRYSLLKSQIESQGKRVDDCSLGELNAVWAEVKRFLSEEEKMP